MSKSTVYLVGAGPGDWKLISLRALELIRKADCIIYDYLVNPRLLKFADKNCKLIYVGKKKSMHILSQDRINQLLVKQTKIHNTIVRFKGGDPFIFGRGAEEALYLKKKNINFEIVPGITSAVAVPAYAGIPLSERSKNSSVGFITGHEDPLKEKSNIDWQALARGLGTLVFLMGLGNLLKITEKLIACGKSKDTPVAVISWGTFSRQKTLIGNLGNIANLAKKNNIMPPAIIVVGEVVGFRKKLAWFENKCLFGKKIVVTRTREQASKLSDRLEELGAEVIEVPTIEIVSLNKDRDVKEAFKEKYDWIFFSSQNGVDEFAQILDRIDKDIRVLKNGKICAIGAETAKSLKNKLGIRADYVPNKFIAESLIKHFNSQEPRGKHVLILRARKARNILPDGLKRQGAKVKAINLYDTRLQKESIPAIKQAFKGGIDLITFTSSSTVENFIRLLGSNYRKMLKDVKLASIGPVTSNTIRKFGLDVAIQAKTYTIEGLVKAIGRGLKGK